MSKLEDFDGSDDSSDEDFCPEQEKAAADSEAASEEEEDGDSEDEGGDEDDTKEITGAAVTKKKLLTKRGRRKVTKKHTPPCTEDKLTDTSTSRRSTRQVEACNNSSGLNATQEKDALESDEDDKEKSRSDALWADFLSDVKPSKASVAKKPITTTDTSTTSTEKTNAVTMARSPNGNKSGQTDEKRKAATEATKQISIIEVLDFAGEEVRVQKTVNADSIKENKLGTSRSPTVARNSPAGLKRSADVSGGAGLGSILNQIGKKKKISVLEKTKLDWNNFKQNEGIDEQLQTFNKGKDGYLERQDFLQRTDLRQFEIEKNLRQTRRNP